MLFAKKIGVYAYTPDHFVAPWASVSGATSDEDVLNGTVYSAATTAGNPCTLAEAMANATAGHVIQIASGVYTGTNTGSRFTAPFMPAASGTSGNEIVFVAQYPAATYHANSSLRSEIRVANALNQGPAITISGQDYIILDGLWLDEEQSPAGATAGVVQINDSVGSKLRRIAVDRGATADTDYGDNGNSIFTINAVNCTIEDCYIYGDAGTALSGQNNACIETYNSDNLIVQNNTFLDAGYGIFIKAEQNTQPNPQNAIVRYNWVQGVHGIQCRGSSSAYVHNNLVICQHTSLGVKTGLVWGVQSQAAMMEGRWYNNTVYGDMEGGGIWHRGSPVDQDGNSYYQDNIVYATTSDSLLAFIEDAPEARATVDNAAATDQGGSPNVVRIPCTAHGISGVSHVTIIDSTNYRSGYAVSDLTQANHIDIEATFTAETFAGTEIIAASLPISYLDRFGNNVYYDETTEAWNYDGTGQTTLAGWQSALSGLGTDIDGNNYESQSILSDPLFVDAANEDFKLQNSAQAALTASTTGGVVGCYVTGNELIGKRV